MHYSSSPKEIYSITQLMQTLSSLTNTTTTLAYQPHRRPIAASQAAMRHRHDFPFPPVSYCYRSWPPPPPPQLPKYQPVVVPSPSTSHDVLFVPSNTVAAPPSLRSGRGSNNHSCTSIHVLQLQLVSKDKKQNFKIFILMVMERIES